MVQKKVDGEVNSPIDGKIVPLTFDIALRPTAIQGIIKDYSDGTPIAMAQVFVAGSNERCVSNLNGEYTLTQLPTGKMRVVAKARDFTPLETDVEIQEAGSLELINFNLSTSN